MLQSSIKHFFACFSRSPIMFHDKVADHPGKASDMIKLRVCANHLVDDADSPIPEKRSDHPTPHVESLIRRPSIDQYHLSIRQLNNRAVALPDIQERDSEVISIKKHSWGPGPPQQ